MANTELEECLEQRRKLRERIKELKTAVKETKDAQERFSLQHRISSLETISRELNDEIRRLQPPEERTKARTKTVKVAAPEAGMDIFAARTWDDLEGTTWSELDQTTWAALERATKTGSLAQKEKLSIAMNRAMGTLSYKQATYICKYYSDGYTTKEIGEEMGVNASTVYRSIKRGMRRLGQCVLTTLAAERHIDADGTFDFMGYAETTGVVTERQREIIYLLLSDDATMRDIADWAEIGVSSVSRVNSRAVSKLEAAAPGVAERPNSIRITSKDWRGKSEQEVCERLGVTPWDYYKMQTTPDVGGIPRYRYEILKRHQMGMSQKEIAGDLGCDPTTVRRTLMMYPAVDVTSLPAPQEYRPRRKRKKADIRNLLQGDTEGNATIGDGVSDEMYRRLLEVCKNAGS